MQYKTFVKLFRAKYGDTKEIKRGWRSSINWNGRAISFDGYTVYTPATNGYHFFLTIAEAAQTLGISK